MWASMKYLRIWSPCAGALVSDQRSEVSVLLSTRALTHMLLSSPIHRDLKKFTVLLTMYVAPN